MLTFLFGLAQTMTPETETPITWTVEFYAAVVILALMFCALAYVHHLKKSKKKSFIKALSIWILGVYFSALALTLPIYMNGLAGKADYALRVIVSSMHQAFQMFTLDVDRDIVIQLSVAQNWESQAAYRILSAELIAAPVLTFAFVLSFFKSFLDMLRYWMLFLCDAYIFSELNERSLALAKSVREKDPKALIVFTGVTNKEDESMADLFEEAEQVDAIIQKKEIHNINFGSKGKRRKLYFFTIKEDETKNQIQSLQLIDKYQKRKNTWLYVFSTRFECEMLLNQKDAGEIIVRRINVIQSLVYNRLYNDGYSIFLAADKVSSGKASQAEEKPVHCLVIGMGRHGTEMVKALAWFGQMPGCRMIIDAYDLDEHAKERFTAQCPELMSEEHNRVDPSGDEASYRIAIHSGVDVALSTFEEEIRQMTDVCYVFISLGSDEDNIRTAIAMRTLFSAMNGKNSVVPMIETVVYQPEEMQALNAGEGISDYQLNPYRIHFIGSMEEMYSVDVIMQSEIEREAEKYHLQWVETPIEKGLEKADRQIEELLKKLPEEKKKQAEAILKSKQPDQGDPIETITNRIKQKKEAAEIVGRLFTRNDPAETSRITDIKNDLEKLNAAFEDTIKGSITENIKKFYRYEYYFRSSSSVVIHVNTLKRILNRQVKNVDELDARKEELSRLEHIRWNAYMRSEQYRFAPETNRLGRLHKDLVPFSQLEMEEQDKDDRLKYLKKLVSALREQEETNRPAAGETGK